jgi:hypothetical protein
MLWGIKSLLVTFFQKSNCFLTRLDQPEIDIRKIDHRNLPGSNAPSTAPAAPGSRPSTKSATSRPAAGAV